MLDKRELLRRREEALKKPFISTKESEIIGKTLLQKAKEDYFKRKEEVKRNIEAFSWEAAGYFQSKARGRIMIYGFGDNYEKIFGHK